MGERPGSDVETQCLDEREESKRSMILFIVNRMERCRERERKGMDIFPLPPGIIVRAGSYR